MATLAPLRSELDNVAVSTKDHHEITEDPTMCVCCKTKKRSANSTTCSKRCEWFYNDKCPQCGRARRSDAIFCSKTCLSHSIHANWCPTCTIRQMAPGNQFCSPECEMIGDPNALAQRPRKRADCEAPYLLRDDDHNKATVVNMFKDSTVMGVVHANPITFRRRQYLNHRAAVESRMSQLHIPKYMYGGEGNEHKRFYPLTMTCEMQASKDGTVYPCEDINCEACQVLRYGFSMQRTGMSSHYCMASGDVAMSWATESPGGLRAVAVVRVVTGNTQLLKSTDEIDAPWMKGYDSCIVTDGDTKFDGTYVFSDDAIEPVYIALLM